MEQILCDSARVHPPNPVHDHPDGTWWFYDEVWADEYGPYLTEEECQHKLDQYCKEVLGI